MRYVVYYFLSFTRAGEVVQTSLFCPSSELFLIHTITHSHLYAAVHEHSITSGCWADRGTDTECAKHANEKEAEQEDGAGNHREKGSSEPSTRMRNKFISIE